MALDPRYQKYAYLARFGQNRQTITYLIEELGKSGAGLSPNQTILIPGLDGNPPQEMPISDAVSFIHEWCDVALNFSEGDLKRLDLGIYTSPRTTLSSISAKINVSSKSPEHLLTGRLQANLAELERSNKLRDLNIDPSTRFDPTAAIKKYNAQVLSLENITSKYKTSFDGLTQPGLVNSQGQGLTGELLQRLVVNHLSDLESTRQLALSRYRDVSSDTDRAELVGAAVATTLNNYLHREHPDFGSYNLYDAVPDVERKLGVLVSTISNSYEAEGGSFADLAQSRTQAAQAAAVTYASRGELYLQLVAKLQGSMDQATAAKTAERIVRELTTDSSPTTSVRALIKQAAQKTGITSPDEVVAAIVADELLAGSLAYQQAAANNTQLQLGGGLFEGQLRGSGIDATFAHKSRSEHQADYERLLGEREGGDSEARLDAINRALQAARNKPLTPGVLQEIQDLGSLLTQEFYLKVSTNAEKGLAQTVKRAEWLRDLQGRVSEKQLAFSKFIYEIEEQMPWNKAFRWGGEQIEKAGNWLNKKTGLPLYGFFGKVAEEIGKFKHKSTLSAYKWVSGWKTPGLRKFGKWTIKHYRLGEYSFSGAWFSGSRELLGRGYKWALTKATSTAAYRSAAVWGNKAIAGLMAKLSPAIISAGGKLAGYTATIVAGVASGIGLVASVVGIALTIVDFVIKPLIGLVKKFFSDPGFAAVSLAIGGALAALGTVPALIGGGIAALIAGLGGALAGLAALFTTALLWSLGAIIVVAVIFKTFDMTTHLDPGNPDVIAQSLADTQGSSHISIEKAVTGSFNGDKKISNSNINQTLTYQVTVTATDIPLTGIVITDSATRTTKAGSSSVGDEQNQTVAELAAGESTTFEYKLKLDPSYRDSYLNNTVSVTATSANGEEQRSYSQSIVIGTPPTLPGGAFAARLAAAITGCYGSKVTIPDGGTCLRTLNDPQIALAVDSLVASARSYTYLQCVGFARAVMVGLGGGLDGRATAADYLTSPPSGYTLFKGTPMAGDLFVMGYDQVSGTGHIGVVTGVAGTMVMVADANWNGYGGARGNGQIPMTRINGYLRRN